MALNKVAKFRAERYSWMTCLFFGGVSLYASRAIFPILSVALAQEMNWNKQEIGLILGIFFWGYAVTQILAGYLSDSIGGEYVIAISSFVWSFTTLSFVWLPRIFSDYSSVFSLFLCGRFILGMSQGFYYPSLTSMMAKNVHPSERNFTYAVLNAGAHFGTLLCGSIGSYVLIEAGWRTVLALVGLLCILWSSHLYFNMLGLRCVSPHRRGSIEEKHNPAELFMITVPISEADIIRGRTKELEYLALSKLDKPIGSANLPLNWSILLRNSSFWVMLLANFVHNNSFYIILNWCPSYFHDNFPDARTWVFNMVPWLIIFPSVIVGGWIADRWIQQGVQLTTVRKLITTVVLLGSSCFLFLLILVDNYYASLAFMALALACLGFHSSGVLLNPQDLAPNHGGRVYGIMATVGTIPGFFGVYLAGYILEQTQQWSRVFFYTGFASIVGWLAYLKYGSATALV